MFEMCEAPVMPDAMISVDQCRAARALLEWSREDLAARAGVSGGTVKNFEMGKSTLGVVAIAIERAITDAGIEILHQDASSGEGVRWRHPRKP